MARPSKRPQELRERVVRMVAEVLPNYPSEWPAMEVAADKLWIAAAETARQSVRRARVSGGLPPARRPSAGGEHAAEAGEHGAAPRQRDPQGGVDFLCGRARPATESLVRFISEHRTRRVGAGLVWVSSQFAPC